MSIKTFKYRLYPTKKQAASLQRTLDCCRELYNASLQERKEIYKYTGKGTSYAAQCAQLPAIKELRPEYKDIYAQVLQDVLKRVDKAFVAFFRRVQAGEKAGYPRYQGYHRYDSLTYPQAGFSLTHDAHVCLSKIGTIKMKLHRDVQGQIKTCTIKREGNHWYICLACEVEHQPKLPYTDEAVGIDLGLHHFAALSTGDVIDNPRPYRRAEQNLRKAQQALSRKKQGSNRRKKAAHRVAKCHRKVRNQRTHFLHEQSRRLVNMYETIVFEDLSPSNMSKRPKAKQDKQTGQYLPNGASQKAGLNKAILDAGWGRFIQFCRYKAEGAGTTVVCVDPYKTSQVCSGCGEEGPHKDLSERTHVCVSCGLVLDRDVNAAIVRRFGAY